MKKAKNKSFGILISVSLLLSFSETFSQKNIRVSVLNESISLPSLKVTKPPFHPTLNIGTDLREKGGKHWKRTFGADAYYYYHKQIEHAIMLDASYRIGYQFKFGLKPYFSTALGYKHAILTGEKYELKNGEYQKSNHLGKAQANLKLGFGFEYPISEKYSLMTEYKIMTSYPSGGMFVPFNLNTFLGAGLKINLDK